MNAKEALTLSIDSCESELKEIYAKIKVAALNGYTTINSPNIKDVAIAKLVMDGYCIDATSIKQLDKSFINIDCLISWDKA